MTVPAGREPGGAGIAARHVPQAVDPSPMLGIVADGRRPPPGGRVTTSVASLLAVAPHRAPSSYDVGEQCLLLVLPARADMASQARRSVRDFAADRGLDVRVDEVMVAVSEAVSNVVEHAHHEEPDPALVLLGHACSGGLRVLVGDDGHWDQSPPGPDRGRGTMLMGAMSDGFARYSDAQGTVVLLSFDPVDHSVGV